MSRITTPTSIDAAPAPAQPQLEAVKRQIGVVPNLFRLVANSPAALEGYLGMSGALAKGSLPAPTRERIALAVAQINGCNYCLSAHSYMGKNMAKLSDAEIAANRHGGSLDPKADAAVRFAAKVVRERGHVSDADVQPQLLQQLGIEQAVSILVALALDHPNAHPVSGRVDVAAAQVTQLAHAQAAGIGRRQECACLRRHRHRQQRGHVRARQHLGQALRAASHRDLRPALGLAEDFADQEAHRA